MISETIVPLPHEPDSGLTRTIIISSDSPLSSVWLRIAAGEIRETDAGFLWNGVNIRVESGLASIRRINNSDELLVQLAEGERTTTVRIHLTW